MRNWYRFSNEKLVLIVMIAIIISFYKRAQERKGRLRDHDFLDLVKMNYTDKLINFTFIDSLLSFKSKLQ